MMKLFTNHKKNYRDANNWIEQMQIREAKKQEIIATAFAQPAVIAQQEIVSQNVKTVFTKADMGHTVEESRQIQQIYAELADVPLSSFFALA